ncbi:MAG: MexH family multidrug efflux RND transporter periplasmic adaptor subunit [Rhodomicrobium sp.]|nr:MAG: MexH family multidrug efflux RND transporter periplasmic adaptor subunit [Rhodomicrobium sp.]
MKRHISLILQMVIFAIALGISAGLWVARDHIGEVFANIAPSEQQGRKSNRQKDQALPVIVKQVQSAANDELVEAVGTGRAQRFVTLQSETAGEIIKFEIRAGDKVKQGDVILELDSQDAALAVRVARNKVLEAKRLSERADVLLGKKITSRANVDDAKNLYNRAKLELAQAKEALSKRQVIAPFDGIVGIPKVELGDRITAATEIITLDDRGKILIEFEIPELFMTRISLGQKISARTPSMEERYFTGIIDQIDARVNPTTRSVTARAVLTNEQDLLRPGMSFAVEITLKGETYPLIPELALNWAKGKSHVWRIKNNTADQVPVDIVKRLNSLIIIKGDIAKGDYVVVEGVQRLRPGSPVSYELPDPNTAQLSN